MLHASDFLEQRTNYLTHNNCCLGDDDHNTYGLRHLHWFSSHTLLGYLVGLLSSLLLHVQSRVARVRGTVLLVAGFLVRKDVQWCSFIVDNSETNLSKEIIKFVLILPYTYFFYLGLTTDLKVVIQMNGF